MLIGVLKSIKIRINYKKCNTIVKTMNIGNNVIIGKNCNISKRTILGDNVCIGNYTYLNANKYWITFESNTSIGSFCSIAPGVHIGAGNHNYKFVTTHPILFDKYYDKNNKFQKCSGLLDKSKKTIIGNDVWIGLNAIIKRGINVGNGAVIAAGAVVTKDVPDYAIVGGNPAKIIRYRTTDENISIIKKNIDKMWWNWNIDEIIKNINIMYNFDDLILYLKNVSK